MSEKFIFETRDTGRERLPCKVYLVEADGDKTVLVAIDVEIDKASQIISWFDTVKERRMAIGRIVETGDELFVFERAAEEDGGQYRLEKMTVELYDQKVKQKLINGQNFFDEAALYAAFDETKKNAW